MEIASFVRDCTVWLWRPISRQYDNYKNYPENLKSLREKAERLKDRSEDVTKAIDSEKSRNKLIKTEVLGWQTRVGTLLDESEKLEKQGEENKRCFGISRCFPHICWRSKISKQAATKATEIDKILLEQTAENVSILPPRILPEKLKWSASIGMEKFQRFSSTESAMNEVMKAFRDDEFRVIGVYGIGGVGKTTMVEQVADQALKEGLFGHVVMATVSQTDHNLIRRVQRQIEEGFGLPLGNDTQKSIASRLKSIIMKEKRVLIILDDIWKELDMVSVGIPCGPDLDNCESKILLTTRLQNVCHRMKCQVKINLQHLSESDSWKFFKVTAGTNFNSPEFERVGKLVAKECGGLPIALVAVGKALGDKNEEEVWLTAAERLKRSLPLIEDDNKIVFNCIKFSYDFLESREQACFLLCCLFPEDHYIEKEEIARYGMGMGFFQDAHKMEGARRYANAIAKKLIASGLLLDGDKEERVKMHDVIRDVAIWITSPSTGTARTQNDHPPDPQPIFLVEAGLALRDWPRKEDYEKYTAISLMSNEIQRLPNVLDCPKLQALLLQENNNLKEIPSAFFQMMLTLRVLDLNGVQASVLPPSIELLKNLRSLSLDRSQFEDIAVVGALKKLEILSLKEISLIYSLPESLANLSYLRMLDLTLSPKINIPANVLSHLSHLEELYLNGGFFQWDEVVGGAKDAGASTSTSCLGELIDLPCLTILNVDIKDVKCVPRLAKRVPNWLKFNIGICNDDVTRSTNALSYKRTTSACSRNLLLNVTINNLPDWFINAATVKTEKLIYAECHALNMVEEFDRGRLTGLKSLIVEQCQEVYYLMNLGHSGSPTVRSEPLFQSLEKLRIHQMDLMKEICNGELPERSLANLKFLEVQQCSDLENSLLQSNLIKRLHNLEKLWVNGNSVKEVFGFEGLKEEQGELYLGKLSEMRLKNLYYLTNIWKGPACYAVFANLKLVTVIQCHELSNLFSVSSVSQGLPQLELLSVEECSKMVEIVSEDPGITVDKVGVPKLKTLSLKNLPMITSFSLGNANLECPSLEHLHVQKCQKFTTSKSDFHSSKQIVEIDEKQLKLLEESLIKRMKESEKEKITSP